MTMSTVPAPWAIASQETVTTFGPAAMPTTLPKTMRIVAITATRHPHVFCIPDQLASPVKLGKLINRMHGRSELCEL